MVCFDLTVILIKSEHRISSRLTAYHSFDYGEYMSFLKRNTNLEDVLRRMIIIVHNDSWYLTRQLVICQCGTNTTQATMPDKHLPLLDREGSHLLYNL